MTKEEIIEKFGKQKGCWYIDIKGHESWMSGNIMDQYDCGYGGFYTYDEAKHLFDNIEHIMFFTKKVLEKYNSEGLTTYFIPKEVFLCYAPLDDCDNEIIEHRRIY